jgi:hypothetical protein
MNSELAPEGDLSALDEQVSLQPAEPLNYEEAFRVHQQKIQRLNEYYEQVVAELLVLLNESEKEAA